MSAYGALAKFYDALTYDVDYGAFADLYEDIFALTGVKVGSILDIACGTGTLMLILSKRGYEMTGTDISEDMLSVAADKLISAGYAPCLIHQSMEELDLYGAADAAICSLDGINYIDKPSLPGVFSRVRYFLEPGGVFIFDINTPEKFRAIDGAAYVDEADGLYCVWRAEFDPVKAECTYNMDIFERKGSRWLRSSEEHIQYAHTAEEIVSALESAGLTDIRTDFKPVGDTFDGRIFFSARKNNG